MPKNENNEISEANLFKILDLSAIELLFKNDEEGHNYMVKIYKCTDKNQKQFAVKTCNNCNFFDQELNSIKKIHESEIYVSSFISNCSIITHKTRVRTKRALKMPLMVEFKDLSSSPEYESKINVYARQLLNQLHFLHKIGIMHGDIKEDNMMYNQETDELCLIDLGSSLIVENSVEPECKDMDYYDYNRRIDIKYELYNSYYKSPEILTEEDLDKYNDWLENVEDIINKITEKGGIEIYKKYVNLEDELDDCSNDDRIDEIEGELDDMEKELEEVGCLNLIHDHTLMEQEQPDAYDVIDFHDEDVIDACELAFTDHVTIYADVYALGKMILHYLDIKDLAQEEFLEKMIEPDISKRISSKDILNVKVFDVLNNDESDDSESPA